MARPARPPVQNPAQTAVPLQARDDNPDLDRILARLTGYYPSGVDLGLARMRRFLADLGDPHLAVPPVFHIAGTNGKGSVAATLRAILTEAGYRTHVFTSPHLVRFHERIVLAGHEITTPQLIALLEDCETVNQGREITFFEMVTAAAFKAFAQVPADFTILETGMGGRLDSTNVIPQPLATIITSVSRDHTAFLGEDLRSIATEKAGILRENIPCIIAPQLAEALDAGILDVFAQKNADLCLYGRDWTMEAGKDSMQFCMAGQSMDLPLPNLIGQHQPGNAATALAALAKTGYLPEREIVAASLQKIDWPARLQKLESPDSQAEIFLDGGHNEDAARMLARQAAIWHDRPLHLVVGMIRTKDPRSFLMPLADFAQSVTFIPVPEEALSIAPEDFVVPAQEAGFHDIRQAGTIHAAISRICKDFPAQKRILIAGSLYLCGHILQNWHTVIHDSSDCAGR